MNDWLKSKIDNITPFKKDQVLIYNENVPPKMSDLINIIIVLGKYHIHSCKWKGRLTSLMCFKNELNKYFEALSYWQMNMKEFVG